MRTVLFVGLLSIADVIRKDWVSENHVGFYVIVFFAVVIFDIIYICKKKHN